MTTNLNLGPRWRMSGAIPLLLLHVSMAWTETTVLLFSERFACTCAEAQGKFVFNVKGSAGRVLPLEILIWVGCPQDG